MKSNEYYAAVIGNECQLQNKPNKTIIALMTPETVKALKIGTLIKFNTEHPPGNKDDFGTWADTYAAIHGIKPADIIPEDTPKDLLNWFIEEGFAVHEDYMRDTGPIYWLGTGDNGVLPFGWKPGTDPNKVKNRPQKYARKLTARELRTILMS